MRCYFVVPIVALFSGSSIWPQSVAAATLDQTAIINFVRMEVPRALNYEQGDRESLMDAENDFTPDGWREFVTWLDGYLDEQGAPTHSSRFTPTGDPVVKRREDGAVRLTLPGTLKQQSKNSYGGISTTTYRVTIDVQVGGSPLKIQHMKTSTCGGASRAASCQ